MSNFSSSYHGENSDYCGCPIFSCYFCFVVLLFRLYGWMQSSANPPVFWCLSINSAPVLCASRHFFQTPSAEMKKPPDPFLKRSSACSPVIVVPFVAFPMVCVCPHISWLQTLSLRSISQSPDPLMGLLLKVRMTPFV